MSEDGMRRTTERVELISATRGEGKEGRSALRSGDVRLETVSVVCIDRLFATFHTSDRPH